MICIAYGCFTSVNSSDSPVHTAIFSCQAAVKKVMSTCPRLNLVQSILSCLTALTNPDVDLSWAKLNPSLVNIKICHNQRKLVLANQRRSFIGVIYTVC